MACLQGTQRGPNSDPLPRYSFVSADTDSGDHTDSLAALLSSLPTELAVACFPKAKLPDVAHTLIRLLLFPESDDRFFSLTSYAAEVSLIIGRAELGSFGDPKSLITNSNSWQALHVQPGPSGVSTSFAAFARACSPSYSAGTGVVTSASSALADKNISIFYLSTFNSDYILVPTSATSSALEHLRNLK